MFVVCYQHYIITSMSCTSLCSSPFSTSVVKPPGMVKPVLNAIVASNTMTTSSALCLSSNTLSTMFLVFSTFCALTFGSLYKKGLPLDRLPPFSSSCDLGEILFSNLGECVYSYISRSPLLLPNHKESLGHPSPGVMHMATMMYQLLPKHTCQKHG